MTQKYYDVYVFDWGCSEGKLKRALLLNRAYHRVPALRGRKPQAGERSSVTYRVAPDEQHNTVTFWFDGAGLCEAVYTHKGDRRDASRTFDAFLAQVKELTKRYGQAQVYETDAKTRTGHIQWTTDHTVIDYVTGTPAAPGADAVENSVRQDPSAAFPESRLTYTRRQAALQQDSNG